MTEIPKGVLGEASKIREECLEFLDAYEQGSSVMEIVELSDLIGAIQEYVKKYSLELSDLIHFSAITRRSFAVGERK